jgi:hypothetical protein
MFSSLTSVTKHRNHMKLGGKIKDKKWGEMLGTHADTHHKRSFFLFFALSIVKEQIHMRSHFCTFWNVGLHWEYLNIQTKFQKKCKFVKNQKYISIILF